MNAATQSMQQMQTLLREALTEACEEQGVVIPDGGSAPVDIDWRTGVVTVGQPETSQPLPSPQLPPPTPLGEPLAAPQF